MRNTKDAGRDHKRTTTTIQFCFCFTSTCYAVPILHSSSEHQSKTINITERFLHSLRIFGFWVSGWSFAQYESRRTKPHKSESSSGGGAVKGGGVTTCICICMYISVYLYLFTYMFSYMYVYMYLYMRMCTCTCMCACMHGWMDVSGAFA